VFLYFLFAFWRQAESESAVCFELDPSQVYHEMVKILLNHRRIDRIAVSIPTDLRPINSLALE